MVKDSSPILGIEGCVSNLGVSNFVDYNCNCDDFSVFSVLSYLPIICATFLLTILAPCMHWNLSLETIRESCQNFAMYELPLVLEAYDS
jgi:hypothetical protein